MNIELQAVTKIVQMVSKCPHLEPVIDSNDKTLLTDGHIDVHSSSESHSKTTFDGRVNVQVKGRRFSKGTKTLPRTFSIAKTDLAGYLKSQGVLYFIVFINPKTGKPKPAYVLLNPFKIQQLIEQMGGNKTIAVQIKPLPSAPSKIENIVRLALQTTNENPDMRVDFKQLGDLSRITVYTDGNVNFNAPVTLTRDNYDFSLVIETAGGMSASVDQEIVIMPDEYVGAATELTVASGDFVFSNPIRRRVDESTFELEISDGLKIRLDGTGATPSGAVSLNLRATLRERFNDLGFYLACVDTQLFSVNGHKSKFEVNSNPNQEGLREHFEYLRTLMSLFDELGVNSSLIEVDSLEGKRGRQIVGLHGVMLGEEEISSEHNEAGRILQPVGRWNLQLIVLQDGDEGKWLCHDLFDPKLQQQFALSLEDESGETRFSRVTPYEILDREHFPYTLNLHLDRLVEAYNGVFEYPDAGSHANRTVLNLIYAADEVDVRKSEFLDAAQSLNSWLIAKEGNLALHQINQWQIAVRKNQLTQDDRFAIRALKNKAIRHELDSPLLVETCCAILLSDAEEIAYCISRMDDDQLTAIQEWPIWALHGGQNAACLRK